MLKEKPWIKWELEKNKEFVPGEVDAVVLSHHIWGFLNTNLSQDAYDIFLNVERSMGFEAWRRVVRGITKRSQADLLKLEDKVLSPPAVAKEQDVLMAIVRWEGALKEYQTAGGEELSDRRRRGGLLRMLPINLRNKVIWDFGADKSTEATIEWLRERLRATSSWGDGGQPVAAIEVNDDDVIEDEWMAELHALEPGAGMEQIAAVFKNALQRRGPPGVRRAPQSRVPQSRALQSQSGPRQAAPRAPPRNRGDLRCANCLKKGHPAAECEAPTVARRKCFECEQDGHLARNCPNKRRDG